jgi:hypothetical protein
MPSEHLHDDRDVEEILKLAVRKAGFSDEDALRQRLHAAGSELGLSDAQIAAAEEQYWKQKAEEREQAEFKASLAKEFWEHLASYIIVNAGLLSFDLWNDGRLSWAFWPIVGWGIGLAFHAWGTFYSGSEDYEKELERWRRRRNRKRRSKQRTEDAAPREAQ